jgi:hypothetical protein
MSYVKFRTGDEADRTAYTPVNGEPPPPPARDRKSVV